MMFMMALSTVERVADLVPEFDFVLRMLATEELSRVELEVFCVVKTSILVFVVASRLELFEPDVLGALHQQVFVKR